jgi:hypothetical protein
MKACNRLLLYAKSGEIISRPVDDIIELLHGQGLIGGPCHQSSAEYFVGDHFMDLITFLGCSPNTALSPADGDNYCFVRVHELLDGPRLFFSEKTMPPFCRQCKQARPDWQDCELEDYCGQCDLTDRMKNWVWRKQGVLSRWVIEIMNIYPHEAVPSPQLFTSLRAATGSEWSYAYLQESS